MIESISLESCLDKAAATPCTKYKELTPRKIISEDFPSVGDMPIMGGWGYSIDDAVIINKNDPTVEKGMPFDGNSGESAKQIGKLAD